MIDSHEKFGNDQISVEVNWNKKVKPCKKIRFTIDGKSAVIEKGDLFALMTIIADNEEQERLLVVKDEEVVGVRKMLTIKTKKAIPEGGTIVFPMTQYMPKGTFNKMLELGLINEKDVVSLEEAKERIKASEESR